MKGKVVERSAVDDATRRSMYELFSTQFDGVTFAQFCDDLDEKNWVLLLHRDDGSLGGFSCMHFYDIDVGGRELTAVYSGDTVVPSSQ